MHRHRTARRRRWTLRVAIGSEAIWSMSEQTLHDKTPGACPSCGALPREGFDSCQAMWDELLAKSFSEFAFARFHRQIVDAYSLQHPDPYCKSARSYAAHLTGLCCHVEHEANPRVNQTIQRWLSGRPALEKPAVPEARGQLTLAHVLPASSPSDTAARLDEWFNEVWSAYSEHHETARSWIGLAMG